MSYGYLIEDAGEQSSEEYSSKASKSSSVGYGNSMSYGYLVEDASEQSSEEYSSKASKSDHSMSYEFVDSLSYRYADSSDESSEHSSKSSKPILNQVCESDASIKRTHLLVSYLVRIVFDLSPLVNTQAIIGEISRPFSFDFL